MTAWTDAIVRHQDRLDRAAAGLGRDLVRDLEAALRTIDAELAKGDDGRPFTFARYQAMRPRLVALLEALQGTIPGLVYQGATVAAQTAPGAVRAALDSLRDIALDLGVTEAAARITFTAPNMAQIVAVAANSPFDGRTWTEWGQKLARDTLSRVETEMRQAVSLGETVQQARKRLEVAADLSRTSAERLSRTIFAAAGDRARMETYRANQDIIQELQFVAVLDLRTSRRCIAASGRRFWLNDPALSAFRPPLHPCCRSVLIPVTKTWESLLGPEGRELDQAMNRGEQASMDGPVNADLDYSGWLKRQSHAYQNEALGVSLAAAFRRGLPLSALASGTRPLSLAELKAMYPAKFEAA